MPNSFFKSSARLGPTPLRYSIGEANISAYKIIRFLSSLYPLKAIAEISTFTPLGRPFTATVSRAGKSLEKYEP